MCLCVLVAHNCNWTKCVYVFWWHTIAIAQCRPVCLLASPRLQGPLMSRRRASLFPFFSLVSLFPLFPFFSLFSLFFSQSLSPSSSLSFSFFFLLLSAVFTLTFTYSSLILAWKYASLFVKTSTSENHPSCSLSNFFGPSDAVFHTIWQVGRSLR